jgi:hypothetical protein
MDQGTMSNGIGGGGHQMEKRKKRDPVVPLDALEKKLILTTNGTIVLRNRKIKKHHPIHPLFSTSTSASPSSIQAYEDNNTSSQIPKDIRDELVSISTSTPSTYCIYTLDDGAIHTTIVDCETGIATPSMHPISFNEHIPCIEQPTMSSQPILIPNPKVAIIGGHTFIANNGKPMVVIATGHICATNNFILICPKNESTTITIIANATNQYSHITITKAQYTSVFIGDPHFVVYPLGGGPAFLVNATNNTATQLQTPILCALGVVATKALYFIDTKSNTRVLSMGTKGVFNDHILTKTPPNMPCTLTSSGIGSTVMENGNICAFVMHNQKIIKAVLSRKSNFPMPTISIQIPQSCTCIRPLGPDLCAFATPFSTQQQQAGSATISWPLVLVRRKDKVIISFVVERPEGANDGVTVVTTSEENRFLCLVYSYDIEGKLPPDIPDTLWDTVDDTNDTIWCVEVMDAENGERAIHKSYVSKPISVSPPISCCMLGSITPTTSSSSKETHKYQ